MLALACQWLAIWHDAQRAIARTRETVCTCTKWELHPIVCGFASRCVVTNALRGGTAEGSVLHTPVYVTSRDVCLRSWHASQRGQSKRAGARHLARAADSQILATVRPYHAVDIRVGSAGTRRHVPSPAAYRSGQGYVSVDEVRDGSRHARKINVARSRQRASFRPRGAKGATWDESALLQYPSSLQVATGLLRMPRHLGVHVAPGAIFSQSTRSIRGLVVVGRGHTQPGLHRLSEARIACQKMGELSHVVWGWGCRICSSKERLKS